MRAIAMKCTEEQFESIKPKLEKEGIEITCISSFKIDCLLVNNAFGKNLCVCNLGLGNTEDRKVYETWDEKVFLEACGIEVEPKFEITKETVLKYQMKDEFPECFEVKLEVGKWMKTPNNGLYCPKEKKDDGFFSYGFNVNGKWAELFVPNSITKNDVLATTQEVQQALEKEAVNRGFEAGVWIKFKETKEVVQLKSNECNYYEKDNSLCIGGYEVFLNGIWHDILSQYTQQEAEEKFNCKII